ncbi:MinD/ParA family protein [Sedimenticola selenatireducens]|nr:MinD/ParA family protein [Sedimenticola selenatireducens]
MIVIASGKGGVGKSTLSANLGIALGSMNQQVCLFDADTNLANINILFGLKPKYTLQECLAGEKSLEDILLPVSGRLDIVPAASGIAEFIEMTADQQQRLITGLKGIERSHDLILVDCAAGIGNSQLSFFLAASCSVLVITPEPTSLTDAFSFLKMAKRYGFNRTVYILVNMTSDLHAARSAFKRFKHATEQYLQLDVGYLGYVLSDPHVPESVRKQKPVMLYKPECLASRCIKVITERLVRLMQHEKTDATLFSRYLEEMNRPFGIDLTVSGETQDSASAELASDQDWQQQSLDYLRKMDRDEVGLYLRHAVSEWAAWHNADATELIRDHLDFSAHGVTQADNLDAGNRLSNVTLFSRASGDTFNQSALPSLRSFSEQVSESEYCAAVQFADLLARSGKT